jgi:hypothetical protein
MFCAGCGIQIQHGLNYCSRCGRRVATDLKSGEERSPLVVAGNIAGVGFVAYIFVLLILSRSGIEPRAYIPITFFYFAALFGLCYMFLRHNSAIVLRGISTAEPNIEPEYLRPATTAQLEEAREFGVGSVTDHTTRTLEPTRVREP